jgi:hypothetical protein
MGAEDTEVDTYEVAGRQSADLLDLPERVFE